MEKPKPKVEGQETPRGLVEVQREVLPNGDVHQVFLPTRRQRVVKKTH